MPASVINATINGINATGGNVAELELQVGGTTAITVNSAGYWVLANPLPIASGGTGSNTGAFSGANLTSLNASSITSGTLAVARGGTGAATLTANNVILGNGTSAVTFVAPGTTSNVLTSNGTAWVSQAIAATGGLVRGTAVTTNGTTTYEFTGLPSTVRQIVLSLSEVANGAATWLIQIGTSGGYETSGYASTAQFAGTGNTSTTGYIVRTNNTASLTGNVFVYNLTGNQWICSGFLKNAGATNTDGLTIGTKTLGGTLDRIRISSANNYTGGVMNIFYVS